jgi:hypothetical protein
MGDLSQDPADGHGIRDHRRKRAAVYAVSPKGRLEAVSIESGEDEDPASGGTRAISQPTSHVGPRWTGQNGHLSTLQNRRFRLAAETH